jgi:hypothetical protein
VADRATQRVAAREGRPVRRPMEPVGGIDQDLAEVTAGRERRAHPDQAHRIEADAVAAAERASGTEVPAGVDTTSAGGTAAGGPAADSAAAGGTAPGTGTDAR